MSKLHSIEDLPGQAKKARKKADLTQVEAAERLGVHQSYISKAENVSGPTWLNLQLRMLEELAGWKIEGPFWRIRKT